jgi:two-component sensor histidine kinase
VFGHAESERRAENANSVVVKTHVSRMDAFEVEHEFPRIGHRIMLLNARAVFYADKSHTTLLLAFEDVTERRAIEREKEELLRQTEELLRQKDVLLREMEHRVANSLQIIASILMIKARTVTGGNAPASS